MNSHKNNGTQDVIVVAQVVGALHVGGAEATAVLFANTLSERGVTSHIVSTRLLGPLVDTVSPKVKTWCAHRSWKFDLGGIRRIVNYLRRNNIAIVHSHSHTTGYIMELIRRSTDLRFIHVFHDHHGAATKSFKLRILDPLLLKNVDAYLAVSRELQERAKKLLRMDTEHCLFMPNGVKTSDSPHCASDGRTIIQVGNIVPPKAHHTAIRAANILQTHFDDLQWLCVGEMRANQQAHVKGIAKLAEKLGTGECLKFPGSRSDVPDLLKTADVGVLTSNTEALPLVLLEYMAEGLPVVVTRVGECGNIVQAAGCGFVAEPGDYEAIADYLQRLLTDPAARSEMGEAGRQYMIKNYSIEAVVDQIQQVYRMLLSGKT